MRLKLAGFVVAASLATGGVAGAQHAGNAARVVAAVDQHVVPNMSALAQTTEVLAQVAGTECAAQNEDLNTAWHAAFDAWVSVSHLRFGPTETDNRAFAIAFWPDSRAKTPKVLAQLISSENPAAHDADLLAEVSIAAQGFYALEFLLFDARVSQLGSESYRCALVQSLSVGIAQRADAILADWQDSYGATLMVPTETGPYRNTQEAVQELYKAVLSGLQFTSETRLGRPLGSFERPRPKRAEAWRSGRSLRHVELSLQSTRALVAVLAADDAGLAARMDDGFVQALQLAEDLNDPVFAGVDDPTGRLKVDILRQSVDLLRELLVAELGPYLGVAVGFNALDGD